MKRLCMLVLFLLLCTVGGAAAEVLTEGEFDYYVKGDTVWGNGEAAVIVDYHLEEGQSELFIPLELAGYPVMTAEMDNLPASVQTVCVPSRIGGVVPPEGREIVEFLYPDVEEVQTYFDWLPAAGIVVNEDEYLLVSVSRKTTINGGVEAEEVILQEDELPREIGGQKVVADLLPSMPVSAEVLTEGEFDYSIVTEDGLGERAEIVGYHLEEGQTELFIPAKIDGCYTIFCLEEIPEQIEMLWYCDMTAIRGAPDGMRKNHQLQVIQYSLVTQDRIKLEETFLHMWDAEGVSSEQRLFIDAAAVPQTIGGYAVSFDAKNQGPIVDGVFITDGWKYLAFTRYGGSKKAEIIECLTHDGSDMLIVPPSLDGYTVENIYLEAIPESVEYVVMKDDGGAAYPVVNNMPSDRVMTVVSYKEGVEPDELVWVGALTHDFATEKWPDVKVRAEDLPEEIDGKKLSFPDYAPDFLFTNGD